MLRKKETGTERTLWRYLRNRNFAGYKFRRQHPLGCYVLDIDLENRMIAFFGFFNLRFAWALGFGA